MPKKSNPLTSDQVARLRETLVNLRNTDSGYPVPAERLLDLVGMDAKLAPHLSAAGNVRKQLQSTAKTTGLSQSSARAALICLAEDVTVVAASSEVLGLTFEIAAAACKGKTQLFTPNQLAEHLNEQFKKPFKTVFGKGLSSGCLPPGFGALKMQGRSYLFRFADVIGGVGAAPTRETEGEHRPLDGARPGDDALPPPPATPAMPAMPGSADPSPEPSGLAERILSTFDRLDAETGSTNYVTLLALRRALPSEGREDFERAVQQLRRDRVVSLDSADGRHQQLAPEETEAGIVEEGRWLTLMKRRNQ